MSELIELVLNLVLELVLDLASVFLEDWGGWRFYLPVLASVGISVLVSWLVPDGSPGAGLASSFIVVVGVGTGIVWEVGGGRY